MTNEHVINIVGSASMPEAIELDKEYQIQANVACISAGDKRTNEDGSYDIHYKVRLLNLEMLTKGKEIIRSKDKTKQSQKLRLQLMAEWNNQGEFEDYYNQQMGLLRKYRPEIKNLLNSLTKGNV